MSGAVHPLFLKSRERELGIVKQFGEDMIEYFHLAEIHKINDFSYRPLTKEEQDRMRVALAECVNMMQKQYKRCLHVVAYENDKYDILVNHNGVTMLFEMYYSVKDALLVVKHYSQPHIVKQVALYDVILDLNTEYHTLDYVVRHSFEFIEEVLRESGYIE